MNRELIEALADRLESTPDECEWRDGVLEVVQWPKGETPKLLFNQQFWIDAGNSKNGCTACIAGHLALLRDPKWTRADIAPNGHATWPIYVQYILEITRDQAVNLVATHPVDGRCPTAKEASQALRNLIRHPDRRNPWEGVASLATEGRETQT